MTTLTDALAAMRGTTAATPADTVVAPTAAVALMRGALTVDPETTAGAIMPIGPANGNGKSYGNVPALAPEASITGTSTSKPTGTAGVGVAIPAVADITGTFATMTRVGSSMCADACNEANGPRMNGNPTGNTFALGTSTT
ncbi:hypothetical protein A5761_14965 [Mycolicibacterium setense]|uniref:hypothetical protein n=1 Tax=Mycolicibacterium setense TaxID=431269 RepID=UPI0007E9658C|nr:hypothetical protein [Mycolicibacterium setense]OBB15041.1 hypothetical protein A5761_14965 [Mycolicibacterium setense]